MKFVEVDEWVFVNLDNISSVRLKKIQKHQQEEQEDGDEKIYYWLFTTTADKMFFSKTFKSKEEAREWLVNLY